MLRDLEAFTDDTELVASVRGVSFEGSFLKSTIISTVLRVEKNVNFLPTLEYLSMVRVIMRVLLFCFLLEMLANHLKNELGSTFLVVEMFCVLFNIQFFFHLCERILFLFDV